jgi:hypothetical protein
MIGHGMKSKDLQAQDQHITHCSDCVKCSDGNSI